MYCTKCGKSYQADFKSCPYCKNKEAATVPTKENFGNYRERNYIRLFQFKQADLPLRMAAMMIDAIILMIPCLLLIYFAKGFGIGLCIIIGWAYYAGLESSTLHGTIGKYALKLEVTDLEGEGLNLFQSTKRYLAHFLSLFTFGIGFIFLAFNDKRQAVHDLLTDCMVLDLVQQDQKVTSQTVEDSE